MRSLPSRVPLADGVNVTLIAIDVLGATTHCMLLAVPHPEIVDAVKLVGSLPDFANQNVRFWVPLLVTVIE